MKSAGKARNNGLYRHIRTSKEIIRNLLNDLAKNKNEKILFLELGVGGNTPVIIKYPFWEMTSQWKKSFYVCINLNEAWAPEEIRRKSLCIDGDIKEILSILKEC